MNKIDYVIDPLIEYNKENQKTKSHMIVGIGTVAYAKEYQTVKIDLGRQIGKSWYIARTATSEDVIVCRQTHTYKTMEKRVKEINFLNSIEITIPSCIPLSQVETDYDTVWVDDASHFDKKELEIVYGRFATKCKQFVLIG
jgi:hypothetical protein